MQVMRTIRSGIISMDEFFDRLGYDKFNKQYFEKFTDPECFHTYDEWYLLYDAFLYEDTLNPPFTDSKSGIFPFCVDSEGNVAKNCFCFGDRRFKKEEDARAYAETCKNVNISRKVAESIANAAVTLDWTKVRAKAEDVIKVMFDMVTKGVIEKRDCYGIHYKYDKENESFQVSLN